ncbi:unnamed protein product [Symbiodinium pilosum]|uniref:Uncharacterized protein n=1 Tax=Symbiodinium pilosum TaxID=2952 RepID=A0A812X517_SYMPI|nr:unnamed protein product [Symbiodinium pilosum]
MRAEGGTHHAAAEPETAPAVFGCHSESQAQAPDVDEAALSACRDEADDVDQTLQASSEVEAKYEYQHSFLDPEEALDHAEPKGLQLDPSLEEDSEDPELNAELDAVWESFFPAAEDSQPRLEAVEPAECEGEDVAEVASVDAGQGLAQAEEPVEAPRAADREGGAEGDELAAAPKVALQAADALKAAREEWLKQFDLSSMDPPPPSPADIADADHRELTRRERIALLERGLAGEKFVGPADDANSELRVAEARRHERKAKMQQLWKQKEEAAQRPGSAPEPVTVPAQQAVEELAKHSFEDLRYAKACYSLSRNAHRLSTGSLVRAVEVLAAGERAPPETNQLACADAVIGALAPQMTSLGLPVMRNCLKAMTVVDVQEQTYLDMLLAQLLVLLRRDSASFPPSVLAALAGSIGSLYQAGVSARRGASSASCAANRRCIDMLNELILRHAAEFAEEELAALGSAYVLTFMDDVLRRTILRGAAAVCAGLRPDSPAWVTAALVQLEEAAPSLCWEEC